MAHHRLHPAVLGIVCCAAGQGAFGQVPMSSPEHAIVYAERDRFAGWPANNGLWVWPDGELLVGFTAGGYKDQPGHNIVEPYTALLARSRDGGKTWQTETPRGLVTDGLPLKPPPGDIDFTHPDLAVRVVGEGYHGCKEKRGGFFVSQDRGKTWRGPFALGELPEHAELKGMELTPRTDYVALGPRVCLFMLSARPPNKGMVDRAFCARTADGGATFQFVSWIVPPSDPYRGVMPSTVRLGDTKLVAAVRRREPNRDKCWVDAYGSNDLGRSWVHLSKVGDTGKENGNPPALARLNDGRLCCVYGNRDKRVMVARCSADQGATWGDELVIRDDYLATERDADLGYPRLAQRADGKLVAMYYWATRDHPQQHIAATVFAAPMGR